MSCSLQKMQTNQRRRLETLIGHIRPKITVSSDVHVIAQSCLAQVTPHGDDRSGEGEQESTRPTIIPAAVISQLNALTTFVNNNYVLIYFAENHLTFFAKNYFKIQRMIRY
jgi:hypothetical protein